MVQIVLLGFSGMISSSLSLPAEIFQAAEDFHRSQSHNRRESRLQIRMLSPDGKPISTAGGMLLHAESSFAEAQNADVLFVPSIWRNPRRAMLPWLPQLSDFLKRLEQRGAALCAVGNGSILLAASGLLNGRAASTHWHIQEDFARRYPQVLVQRRHLITCSGNIYCAGSVNSVADLAIYLIGKLYGEKVAFYVERHFSPEIRRPFMQHAYLHGAGHTHFDEEIIQIQEWMRKHLQEKLSIARMAQKFSMHPRTLQRRFRHAVGQSPMHWLSIQRMEQARALLRDTDLSITEIATRSGYQDTACFSLRFRSRLGITPSEYRKNVRGKLFALEPEKHKFREYPKESAPA